MADGNIVYQGPAIESPAYFGMLDNKKAKFQNPCDFYMKELSVNYPKTEEDETRLAKLISHYKHKCEQNILKQIHENSFDPLDARSK